MNAKRIKAIGKLFVLFGLPLAVLFGLFSCGVYCGAKARHEITSFEKEWLGLDVEVAPPYVDEDVDDDGDEDGDEKKKKEEDADKAKKDEDADKAKTAKAKDEAKQDDDDDDAAADDDDDAKPTDTVTPIVVPMPVEAPVVEPKTDPLDGDLATRLEVPVKASVKVLVDRALVEEQPVWIDYVQRTVSQASSIYREQFGIELTLVSVGRWPVATEGMSSRELLDDIRSRPREGADILIGFTNRPFDDRTSGMADTPEDSSPYNGAYGVVYATPRHRNAHLRTLLHEVAHVFGALDIADTDDPDFASGSWMSYAPVPETQAPWIDPKNRAKVLERKDKPFRPEPEGQE